MVMFMDTFTLMDGKTLCCDVLFVGMPLNMLFCSIGPVKYCCPQPPPPPGDIDNICKEKEKGFHGVLVYICVRLGFVPVGVRNKKDSLMVLDIEDWHDT